MAPSILQDIDESHLRQVASRYELDLVVLFGSYAKGRARPDSDVDLAVHTTRPDYGARDPDAEALWEMELFAALGEAVPAPEGIDLVMLNRAESTLQFQIASDGIPLHKADPLGFRRFRCLAARRYDDAAKFRRWGWEYLKRRCLDDRRPGRTRAHEAAQHAELP